MNLFHPRTFSTDWEVMVVDKLDRCVETDKLKAFAGFLSREYDLPVNIDWYALEFALGINASFEQLWGRIRTVTDRATQIVREFDLDLFPAAAHPVMPIMDGAHFHVGTLHDETAGLHLENQMLRYAPAFAALAANSPASRSRRGEFKSYRVRDQAHGCTTPITIRDPQLAQNSWGNDASAKLYGAPTLEVRICDCASSRRLLAELAVFIAAFVHHRGTQELESRYTPVDYRDCLTNRWAAARYGLQATFMTEGRPRPVVEILDQMLDECGDELRALGVKRSDLNLLDTMIRKRVCQADLVLDLAERYPDPWCLASAYAKLIRHWDAFDGYLESAAALEPVAAPDEEAILEGHLALIGEGTHFYHSREAMHYPPPAADEIINRMLEQGMIRKEVTPNRGILLSRTG
jgi:gamma-glutamyl:cysteine ligase YbdK (ATP-grasp superfamily)